MQLSFSGHLFRSFSTAISENVSRGAGIAQLIECPTEKIGGFESPVR